MVLLTSLTTYPAPPSKVLDYHYSGYPVVSHLCCTLSMPAHNAKSAPVKTFEAVSTISARPSLIRSSFITTRCYGRP